MAQRILLTCLLTLLGLTLTACPGKKPSAPGNSATSHTSPPAAGPAGSNAASGQPTGAAGATPLNVMPPASPGAPPPPVKQVVLIYTGDTLSAMQPMIRSNDKGQSVRRGGLSALTSEIFSYEAQITALTRERIQAAGGDVSQVRTDADKGLLGEHPYLLLDYGGWERATDAQGAPYVALQLQMYRDLHYHAVGCQQYDQLPDAIWKDYAKLAAPQVLVNSAGPTVKGALPTLKVVTREAHGALWGVVSVPLPAHDTPDGPVIQQYVDAAAAALAQAGCKYGILLCKGGPRSLYEKLRTDTRFAVVIGVSPPKLAVVPGFGELRQDGPLMLPELQWGGQEYGTCHLIYPTGGAAPTQYHFERNVVDDDLKSPFPYRAQVAAAMAERKGLQDAARAAAPPTGN